MSKSARILRNTRQSIASDFRLPAFSRSTMRTAFAGPLTGDESTALGLIVRGLAIYADAYSRRYEGGTTLADDGVIGDAWLDMVKAAVTLLNGELAGLDGGTMDGLLRALASANGFEGDTL